MTNIDKVLILTSEFLPLWGGIGSYVVGLTKNLPSDLEILIVTPFRKKFGKEGPIFSSSDYRPRGDYNYFRENVRVKYISTASDTFFYNFKFQLNVWRVFYEIVKKEKPDIIHTQSTMPDLFINPHKIKIPIITTIHTTIEWQIKTLKELRRLESKDLEFSEVMTKLFSPIIVYLENRYYKKRKFFITVSEFGKKLIAKEKNIPLENIRVIYNGVDPEEFTPQNRKKAKEIYSEIAEKDELKILYLSRFIARKGFLILLKAIPKILEKIDAHFVFAGPGLKPDFKSFGIPESSYTYLGYIYPPHYLYSIADIFVLPSFSENFPLSVLEAMSSEICTVATRVGGIPEMIEHNYNGLSIPPGDVDSLTQALIYLAENEEERKKLAKNGRKTVLERFTLKKCAESTLKYYEEVVENESFTH